MSNQDGNTYNEALRHLAEGMPSSSDMMSRVSKIAQKMPEIRNPILEHITRKLTKGPISYA